MKLILTLIVIAMWIGAIAAPQFFPDMHGASFLWLLFTAGLATFGLVLLFPSTRTPDEDVNE